MAHARIEDTVLVVHGPERPAPAEWSAYVEFATEQLARYGELKVVVATGGTGPNAAQRGDLNDVVADRPSRVAVLNESAFVRGIAKAFAWIGRLDVRLFAPNDLESALRYVESGASAADVQAQLDRMQDELGGGATRRVGER